MMQGDARNRRAQRQDRCLRHAALILSASLVLGGCGASRADRLTELPRVVSGQIAAPIAAMRTARPGPLLNALRARTGRAPVTRSAALDRAARRHARDMVRRGYFDHVDPSGGTVGDRARSVGYPWCRIAENIAWGQQTVAAVLRGWERSPAHRRNMISSDMTEFGFARHETHWVMVLAARNC